MSKWVDIAVREDSGGSHYLLQMRVRRNGKKVFKNRRIDGATAFSPLFHGMQHIEEPILEVGIDDAEGERHG